MVSEQNNYQAVVNALLDDVKHAHDDEELAGMFSLTLKHKGIGEMERQLHEARALLEGVGNANPLGTAGEEAEVGVICHYCQVFMLYAEEKGFNSILRDKAKEEGKHHYERAYDASEYIKEEFPHSLGCAWVKIRAFLKQ